MAGAKLMNLPVSFQSSQFNGGFNFETGEKEMPHGTFAGST